MIVAGVVRLMAPSHAVPGGGRGGGGAAGGKGAVAVSATQPQIRPFVDKIDVLGVAKGRQSVTITANATELITGVHFSDGAFVRKGQVLVDLKAQEQNAGISQAQAALDLADINYRRWKRL